VLIHHGLFLWGNGRADLDSFPLLTDSLAVDFDISDNVLVRAARGNRLEAPGRLQPGFCLGGGLAYLLSLADEYGG